MSEISRKRWDYAKAKGHETCVKLQINNTWECSTTPYVPVFRTVFDIIRGVIDAKVDNLMLSWTLGGYASPNIKLISELFFVENGSDKPDFEKSLKTVYGDKSKLIMKATDKFCEAFANFPFDVEVLYNGPQNGGPSNPLYLKPTGYKSTMTCYSYDDIHSWRSVYPEDVFENQFKVISEKWEEGLEDLSPLKNTELYDVSYITYSLFKSSYNQIKFVLLRDRLKVDNDKNIISEIISIINNEIEIAKEVYRIMCYIPEIGYEAANHYYFNISSIEEKLLNCHYLLENYQKLIS